MGKDFALAGQWVEIGLVVLEPGHRAPQVPADTQAVPLEMKVRGFIDHDASKGEEVTIHTVAGRLLSGTLVAVEPFYNHNFGAHVAELAPIGMEIREILAGEGGGQ